MSTVYGPYSQHDGETPDASHVPYGANGPYGSVPPPAPPPPAWAGKGGPGLPPYAGPGRPPRRPHGRAMAMVAGAAVVAAAAGGTALATASAGNRPLSTADIASRVDPGLVDVTSTLGYQRATAEGTGMVLTSSGEVLTNNHVVAGATSVTVRDIGNGKTYHANVVGYSVSDDVAVLQLKGASGLPTVPIGDSSKVAAGQKIVALGNALGKGGTPSVATGSVTATGATIVASDGGNGSQEHLTGMIRTNANIQPGDSGGPLVNASGQVVGMDTAASSNNSTGFGTTSAVTTATFSIPINRALSIANQVEAGSGSATVHVGATAFLGVSVAPSSAGGGFFGQASGVAVEGTVPGTAAAAAGLAQGDTIDSVGAHQIASSSQLQSTMEGYHPGDKVSLSWTDEFGQQHAATVTLTAGPTG